MHHAEAHVIAVFPLEVVDERPQEIALHGVAIAYAPQQFAEVVAHQIAAMQVIE
jgi:hypothetical protein